MDLPLSDEAPLPELSHGLLQLRLRVHHNRTVPRDRLLQRPSRDKQKSDAFVACRDRNLVAAFEQDEGAVASPLAYQGFLPADRLLRQDAERFRCRAERTGPLENIGKCMPVDFYRQCLAD